MMVGWLELNVPFQHKYGYITDKPNNDNVSCFAVFKNAAHMDEL